MSCHIDGLTEVTLHRPIPLETSLPLVPDGMDRVRLGDPAAPIAVAQAIAGFELDIPPPPTLADAAAAAAGFAGLTGDHPAPDCFVCGTRRGEHDGLRIYAGRLPGSDCHAAPWIPDPSLDDGHGRIRTEFIWAVLDCPGAPPIGGTTLVPALLGRLAVRILQPVTVGEQHVVMGWLIHKRRRKNLVGTALYSADGTLCACGQATWIEPRSGSLPT